MGFDSGLNIFDPKTEFDVKWRKIATNLIALWRLLIDLI